MTTAEVTLWGTRIGAVVLGDNQRYAEFQYAPEFTKSGIEVSPIVMPLKKDRVYKFPLLSQESFSGLPGLLADSLPDSFGQAIISAWLAKQGRGAESLNAVERLCYTGRRGMGALEYSPVLSENLMTNQQIYVDSLVELASEIVNNRENLNIHFSKDENRNQSFAQIMQIGTSAGGARAKAIISWNKEKGEIRSGQINAGDGFGYYLLKFDGISGNRDKEEPDGEGYTNIEYAYYKMALHAGIEMSECELLKQNKLSHFITRRFDRGEKGEKIHMQSLGAIAHYDFRMAGAYSYEQAFQVLRGLGMGDPARKQLFLRMAFNVIAMNRDDHVKNISFLMDRRGVWTLAPAYDVTYAYNPMGQWTSKHQMSVNGKRDGITNEDLLACANNVGIKGPVAKELITMVEKAVNSFSNFAEAAEVPPEKIRLIEKELKANR